MSAPFSKISKGPANAAGTSTSPQSLQMDRQNTIVEAVGDAGTAVALQSSFLIYGPQTALTSITTAQNLFSQSLNAGVLNKLNRILQITGSLVYTSPGTTTPTISIAVVLGSVTLCTITTAAISSTASTNLPIQFFFTLQVTTTGTSGALEVHGNVSANITANTPAAAVAAYLDTNTAASSTLDLTAAQTLKVTIASSGAGITGATLRQALVEVIN